MLSSASKIVESFDSKHGRHDIDDNGGKCLLFVFYFKGFIKGTKGIKGKSWETTACF